MNEEISGVVERVTYANEESHFVVAKLLVKKKLITITGTIPSIQVGEILICKGSWKAHSQHGVQFEVASYTMQLPQDVQTLKKYLGSGAFKGIGVKYAEKIVDTFQEDTLSILENDPEKLYTIPNIGKKRVEGILRSWNDRKSFQEIMLFFHGYNISQTFAKKILKKYGQNALKTIKENPFQLAKDIRGIGFKMADQIAKNAGIEETAPSRIEGAIDYALYELAQNGHACASIDLLVRYVQDVIQLQAEDLIKTQIGRMFESQSIQLKKTPSDTYLVWSRPLFMSELGIAKEMKRLKNNTHSLRKIDIEKAIEWSESIFHITLAPEQKEALRLAIEEKVMIITGGPGTGKSTITKALVAIFEKLTKKIVLAAPTGKAAKRLAEITRKHAATIHRILKFDFTTGSFKYNKENPIDCDLFIVDESSMIDTYLMYQLLRALPNHAKVIIIGDADQLPSIGPGTVFRDIIGSERIPCAQLKVIFRQAKGSNIIVNAHRINEGAMPYTNNEFSKDFFFLDCQEADEVRERIIQLVTEEIPKKYGFDPKKEIQILAPMKKGACGIDVLNMALQQKYTSPTAPKYGMFIVGDKVMQIRNNYTKDVFNGDMGIVSLIDRENEQVTVDFDEKKVIYEVSELDELLLAYAVSIHKYQGSECPCIVIPVHTSHFKMLTKNLLYTAVTRARKLVYMVGTKKALAIGVKNESTEQRMTYLKGFLEEELGVSAVFSDRSPGIFT